METFLPLNVQKEETNKKEYRKKIQNDNKNQDGNANKKGRIVIRNLPYKIEEEDLVQLFKPFGEVVEVTFLKFEDGRKKGVAFLQYNNLLSALKAVKDCNMKKLMGRPIAVDMAVSKDRYKTAVPNSEVEQTEIKIEDEKSFSKDNPTLKGIIPLDKIKKEKEETEVRTEPMDTKYTDNDIKEEETSEDDDDDDSDVKECDDDDDDMEDDDDDDSMEDNDNKDTEGITVKKEKDSSFSHKPVSNDVLEGRTLFIKSLSFDVSEEDVSELISQFGEVKYVLFCRDKLTQRFRGTAFAQFVDKASCDSCLEAFNDPAYKNTFRLGGRFFSISPAVGREDITKKDEIKKEKKEPQDKRNLYLAREGVIREGTQPAIGVSKSDLALRVVREKIKRKMLVNFNIFMSPTRLYICNLPLELTDKKLKDIVIKYSPKGTVLKECRIMKNLFECDRQGNPVSKGHGFIAFTQHSQAIEALRNINNNPDIFTPKKRPIVEFSMENKAALKAKEMRIQRSKDGNKRKELEKAQAPTFHKKIESSSNPDKPQFMGSNYDPKKKGLKAFHTHIGPKVRHRDSAKKVGGKITRNKVNNQLRNSSMMKRKKNNNQNMKSKLNKAAQNLKKNKKSTTKQSKTKKKKFI